MLLFFCFAIIFVDFIYLLVYKKRKKGKNISLLYPFERGHICLKHEIRRLDEGSFIGEGRLYRKTGVHC
jgi:hypothetical protein